MPEPVATGSCCAHALRILASRQFCYLLWMLFVMIIICQTYITDENSAIVGVLYNWKGILNFHHQVMWIFCRNNSVSACHSRLNSFLSNLNEKFNTQLNFFSTWLQLYANNKNIYITSLNCVIHLCLHEIKSRSKFFCTILKFSYVM